METPSSTTQEVSEGKLSEPRIRWAPKVRQDKIRRVYENDATGLTDEALVDDTGWALYARCDSLLMVNRGEVKCPVCATRFSCVSAIGGKGAAPMASEMTCAPCPTCGWTTTKKQYHYSWKHADLNGTRALSAFAAFVEKYPLASTPRERVLLMDRLIHAFHHGLSRDLEGADIPHRSAANNLIEGSHEKVVAFLDALTYGDGSAPELRQSHTEWRQATQKMWQVRRGG